MNIQSKYIEAHLFRAEGEILKFLLLRRAQSEKYAGIWQMVSGKVKNGETAHQAALREICEETGIRPSTLWVVPRINSFYEIECDAVQLVPVFAAMVDSSEGVRLSEEHDAFRWVSPARAKALLAWEGQRKAVDLITGSFQNCGTGSFFSEITLPG